MLLFIGRLRPHSPVGATVSIHPMLLFIEFGKMKMKKLDMFQYIPCYSLSSQKKQKSRNQISFNTSHVTLYHYPLASGTSFLFVSIHPMLLFISAFWSQFWWLYSVSIHPMLLFITSPSPSSVINRKFQYIPCYSLSSSALRGICRIPSFQYIPCYSLSRISDPYKEDE